MSEPVKPCDHSDLYVGLKRQPCHCGRPGCTKTDTGTSNDTCPHWAEDRIKACLEEVYFLWTGQHIR